MKIRQGFVSNSSSSSFIIFGKSIYGKNITKELIAAKRIYACAEEYDGADFFAINQKMFDMYMKYGGSLDFYNVDKVIREEGILSKDDIEDKTIYVFTMSVSQHSVQENDLEEFITRFIDLPAELDPEEMRKKASKIEEFQKQLEAEGLEAYTSADGITKIREKQNED